MAIDGLDAAGKTTLAQELAPLIQAHGRPVIRASIDGFHNPARIRYQRGATSPEGYYHDSFNYQALVELLLTPLGPDGALQYCSAVFDHRTDSEIQVPLKAAEVNAVLLFDGIFLLRPELREHWDFTVFVEAAFEVTLARAMQRDLALFGSAEEVRKRYEQRYIPGQELYFEECQPKERAKVVVDNNTAVGIEAVWVVVNDINVARKKAGR
ncbi:MAG: uridine kinase [Acidobacteriota bacterium]